MLNYGGVGFIIAREVMHGFDNQGGQYDKNGQLAEWWSSETLEKFVEKSECFRDQYGAYRVPELDEMMNTTVYVCQFTFWGNRSFWMTGIFFFVSVGFFFFYIKDYAVTFTIEENNPYLEPVMTLL